MSALSPEEIKRYARHIVLRGVGGDGQQKLKSARVLVIGAGGLGSPAIAYLAAAGVGTLGVVDHDTVSLSNLQRQMIHQSAGIGTPKAESAGEFVAGLNAHVEFVPHIERISSENAARLMEGYTLVLDGTDNFGTRAIVAEAAEEAGLPLVSGAVSMFDGQVTVFMPGGKSFRDLYPDTPDEADLPACEVVGVLGAVTGVIGTLMAMEAIKLVTGVGEPLVGRLLLYDGRAARFTELMY
ncbi:molybdopterin-synthase adenylyltransferase MoeB [Devosia sp. ZB163]|uniref:HesA/MoeB/ThiF family protein n=1 Tax=Devosia sp. ZB163 TaxID=3025938 RepID=UPI0023606A73|nr:molybdopterin-synthase adenylyltransferase MoeB [Devosia sp. ZB163]MDC9822682.1 molybdopterin-synthase adenylyltransferase MoeB [Devosia sp. ZB163]